jgi:hypothetical protein
MSEDNKPTVDPIKAAYFAFLDANRVRVMQWIDSGRPLNSLPVTFDGLAWRWVGRRERRAVERAVTRKRTKLLW